MKFRFTVFLCLGILTTLLLSACNSKTKTAKIKITCSSWSGWSADYEPEVEEKSFTVKEGDNIELGGFVDLSLQIKKISEDEVIFETNTPMSDNDNGTINMNTDKTKFTINDKEELKLMTPTMDAGESYIFSLQK